VINIPFDQEENRLIYILWRVVNFHFCHHLLYDFDPYPCSLGMARLFPVVTIPLSILYIKQTEYDRYSRESMT
jgi:hypothetical protein